MSSNSCSWAWKSSSEVLRAEHLDLDAELLEAFGLVSELHRTERVGRLVDQVSGGLDTFGDRLGIGPGLLDLAGMIGDQRDLARTVRIVLLLGLVFVELVGAKTQSKGKLGAEFRGKFAIHTLEDDGRFGSLDVLQLAVDLTTELQSRLVIELGGRADTGKNQSVGSKTCRGQDVEEAAGLAGESGGGNRPIDSTCDGRDDRLADRAGLVVGVDKHHQHLGICIERLGKRESWNRRHDFFLIAGHPLSNVPDLSCECGA